MWSEFQLPDELAQIIPMKTGSCSSENHSTHGSAVWTQQWFQHAHAMRFICIPVCIDLKRIIQWELWPRTAVDFELSRISNTPKNFYQIILCKSQFPIPSLYFDNAISIPIEKLCMNWKLQWTRFYWNVRMWANAWKCWCIFCGNSMNRISWLLKYWWAV